MFEYMTANGNRISINPKYITAISDTCNEEQCYIFTVNGSYLVMESYETVGKHWSNWFRTCRGI
jgi:hypothetical protein